MNAKESESPAKENWSGSVCAIAADIPAEARFMGQSTADRATGTVIQTGADTLQAARSRSSAVMQRVWIVEETMRATVDPTIRTIQNTIVMVTAGITQNTVAKKHIELPIAMDSAADMRPVTGSFRAAVAFEPPRSLV